MPVPETAMDCCAPETFSALSVSNTFSLSGPVFSGRKLTRRVHSPPTLTLLELVHSSL